MRKILLLSILSLFTFTCFSQKGWRDTEMEVKVFTRNPAEAHALCLLHLNGEYYPSGYGLFYLVPSEFQRLQASGLDYQVLKSNLKEYYKDFWQTDDSYHTYAQIIALMDSLANAFPSICQKYNLGTSAGGRQLSALKISDNAAVDENEPEVYFDGGIHGDEIGGPENLIRFARELCTGYGTNTTYTSLIDSREIWIYPMINPDGRESMSRYNDNGVDINRDCGYMWNNDSPDEYSQPETKTLRDCMFQNQFVVYTSYHSGTEFISYPWSYRPDACPDNAQMNQLGGIYASLSGYSGIPYAQGYSGMYPINGSTKDACYGSMGGVTWSIEISLDKQPPASQIQQYYAYNKPSMLAMIQYAGYGLEGTVTDSLTGTPVAATVFINNYFPCYTDPVVGDYHKYVLPGTYSIKVMANGYQTKTISNVTLVAGTSVVTNFQLKPLDGHYVYKVVSCQIPGNNFADEGNTPAVIGAPDDVYYSIGKSGWIVVDMQDPVIDGPGSDIRVVEGGTTPEGYTVYASMLPEGPWVSLGSGTGTSDFDLLTANLILTRYLKIVDDGDGLANVADAGFDLDAVQALPHSSGVYLSLMNYNINDASGNNNGKIDPGETVTLNVTLLNSGDSTATGVSGLLSMDTAYLVPVTANASFGTMNPLATMQGSFSFTAKPNVPGGQLTQVVLNVNSNSGSYTNSFTINLTIGQIPVVVIDLDGNHNSGPAIQAAIQANGIPADYVTSMPSGLNEYTSAFVCLGIYSNNHQLSSAEGQILADYLNNGGRLYMEGGDTWYYDPQTAVYPLFKITGVSDGSGDLTNINGMSGAFTAGMSFPYSGDNNWIDHISAVSPAYVIFTNQTPAYNNAVAYDGTSYKTIGASFEFGGLSNGSGISTKNQLMQDYLNFFGISATLTANFSATTTSVCAGNSVTFNDLSTGGPTSWSWSFPGGVPSASSLQNPTVTYSTPGSYDVALTVFNSSDSSTLTKSTYITVNAIPAVSFAPLATVCINWPVFPLTGGLPAGGSYSGPGVTGGNFNPAAAGAGTHTLTYSFTSPQGCTGSATQTLVVSPCTGFTEVADAADIEIVPNPSTGQFQLHLNLPGEHTVTFSVLNSFGQEVLRKTLTLGNGPEIIRLDIGNPADGLYYLRIAGEKQAWSRKLVIH